MKLGLGAWVTASLILTSAVQVQATDDPPAGLTRGDWGQLRRAVQAAFVHEAQVLGHGDPLGQAGAGFGLSASVSGDTAVVAAPYEDTAAGVDAGAAYVFVRSGTAWTPQQRLVASDGAAGDEFGQAVSVSGDTAVVGAWLGDTPGGGNAGAAYVFVRSGTTWTEQQKLVASDGAASDFFGISASISGDTVVVGAYAADTPGGADAGAAYVFVRSGTTWTEQQKLVASDGAANDRFGYSVSVSTDTAVVGADRDDTAGGGDAGSAYVFVRSGTTWTEQQKLLASDGAAGDFFGHAVSLSGDTVVAGSYTAAADAGAAYVFVRSGTVWTEQQKLLASDGAANDLFGVSVSLSADTAVIGAYLDDTPGGTDTGSAYVFVRSGTVWTEQQKLVASDGAASDFFGQAVAVFGDTVVAGAYADDTPAGADAGSAYMFVRSGTTWSQQDQVLAFGGTAGDAFGISVSVSGDTAVIGTSLDDTPAGADAGSAYVFVRSGTTWTEQQKLLPSDGAAGDEFGQSVSVSGDTVVVGAWLADTPGGANAGAAYVFVRSGTTWTEQQKLVASDGAASDGLGISASIDGNTVVAGAYADDTAGGADAGSAYVFVRSGTTWTEQQKLLASDGAAADRFGYSVSLSVDTAVVGADRDDTAGGADAGSAYVFVRSGTIWTEQQKLVASDGAASDAFGHSLSVSVDTAVVGAYLDNTPTVETGSAYVFVRSGTTWTEQQKLVASDGAANDLFGVSVSLSGDTAVIGAYLDDTPGGTDTGSAYVFERVGTTWTEQPKLLAPDGAPSDFFGESVAIAGDTVVVGAYADDTSDGTDAGSAHVFRGQGSADLGVTKTDGQGTAVPGEPLTYTIAAGNGGPDPVTGAVVTDVLPAALLGATWTCVASPGSSCTPSGAGDINDSVNLPVGGSVTYTLTATVASGATGTLSNTVTITPPAGVTDPDPASNTATDTDTLAPQADLGITKTDSADPVSPGDPLTYLVTVANAGPSDATVVTMTDTLPSGVTFVSSVPPSPTCTLAGPTLTCALGSLAAGANATVTIDVTVNGSATGMLVNTAVVAANEPDPDSANNAAVEATVVSVNEGEVTHGMNIVHDLAAQPGPVADVDVFLISQKPFSSYEVVVDATSGDVGAGAGPLLERIHPNGATILQDSSPVGTGSSRSLRWANTTSTVIDGETVRVRSAQCGTDCGPDDTYRIRAYETTYSVPRFNNSGTQVTVLVLHNPTSYPIAGQVYFGVASGTQVAVHSFALAPKATLVLNTATVPGASGVSGALTVAHDGRYSDLSGKTVALEPATGFSFDSALEPRRK